MVLRCGWKNGEVGEVGEGGKQGGQDAGRVVGEKREDERKMKKNGRRGGEGVAVRNWYFGYRMDYHFIPS